MNHIITLKDGSYYRISKEEANTLFTAWSNQDVAIDIPRGIKVSSAQIKTISDIDSWIKYENMTLERKRQQRCQSCLGIKAMGTTCVCKEKDRPTEYKPKGAQGLIDNLKPKKNVTKEETLKTINLLIKHFSWAKEWWENEKGKKSVLNYAKVVAGVGYFYLNSKGNEKIFIK